MRDAGMGRVHECQTPVFLYPQFTGAGADRRVRIHADVPRESPTVRGLVALLVETLDGAAPEEVAAVPDDLLAQLGIAQHLGARRQQGFAGVLRALKRAVADLERDFICQALSKTSGNRTQAARLLEISLRNLLYKIKEYGLHN